jgi:hypothetical protein
MYYEFSKWMLESNFVHDYASGNYDDLTSIGKTNVPNVCVLK